jgi:hypothetical protein
MAQPAASGSGQLAYQLLFLLRFIQLGSTVITGFIACYFVWWHVVLRDPVPPGMIAVICTVSFPSESMEALPSYLKKE